MRNGRNGRLSTVGDVLDVLARGERSLWKQKRSAARAQGFELEGFQREAAAS
jgi:hypothetical protein